MTNQRNGFNAMAYNWMQRRKIDRKAKAKVGMLEKQTEDDFMQECIADAVDDGSDPDEAELMCQIMWDEENPE